MNEETIKVYKHSEHDPHAEVAQLRAAITAALTRMALGVGECCRSKRHGRERPGFCESFGCSSMEEIAELLGAKEEFDSLVKPIATVDGRRHREWRRRWDAKRKDGFEV